MANPILDQIKLSGVTYDIQDSTALHDLDNSVTSGGTNAVKGSGIYNAITAATGALAETIAEELSGKTDVSAFTAHTADTDIHVTVADKTAWNAKLDAADVAGLFGNVAYDSTNKRINFYHESTGGTVLAYVDATDFVKDGFLESVTLENKVISGESVPCLVFIWNTDSGLQETDIPVSGIFDPSNYYTKTDVDNAISAATSGKADSSTVVTNVAQDWYEGTQQIYLKQTKGGTDMSTPFIANGSGTTFTKSGGIVHVNVDTTIIQEKLVNQTNIKSINGTSLLGSGDITVQSLPTVSGTTLIF